jgi:GNAT superfamily N-acetyltransferase
VIEAHSGAAVISQVRRIRPDEWDRLRALRLHALADAPLAFGSTLSLEEAFPEGIWRERAAGGAASEDRATFIAEQDGRWIGLATGLITGSADPVLVGMFVDGSARRRGVAVALIESVVGWVQSRGAARLLLWVTSGNEAAIALYRRCGFQPTGGTRSVAHTPTLIENEMIRGLHSSDGVDRARLFQSRSDPTTSEGGTK